MLSEDEEQEILVDWMDYNNILYFAIPNGGKRPIQTAVRLKRTGVKAGVPDLMICLPRGVYAGLFIELKRKVGGIISLNQKLWLKNLNGAGYKATACRGADEAINLIQEYLGS